MVSNNLQKYFLILPSKFRALLRQSESKSQINTQNIIVKFRHYRRYLRPKLKPQKLFSKKKNTSTNIKSIFR